MTRTEQLLSIGLMRIEDIFKKTGINQDTVRYRIKTLGIIPFEKWWFDEYQLDLIINFETVKKNYEKT